MDSISNSNRIFRFHNICVSGIPTDTELHYEYVSNATDNFTETTYTYIVPRNETTRLGLYTVGVLVKGLLFLHILTAINISNVLSIDLMTGLTTWSA